MSISGLLILVDGALAGSPAEAAALQFLDKSQWIVIYCGGGDCDASHNLAQFLGLVGYNKCLIMKVGYPAWAQAGHPTATGKPEIGAP